MDCYPLCPLAVVPGAARTAAAHGAAPTGKVVRGASPPPVHFSGARLFGGSKGGEAPPRQSAVLNTAWAGLSTLVRVQGAATETGNALAGGVLAPGPCVPSELPLKLSWAHQSTTRAGSAQTRWRGRVVNGSLPSYGLRLPPARYASQSFMSRRRRSKASDALGPGLQDARRDVARALDLMRQSGRERDHGPSR